MKCIVHSFATAPGLERVADAAPWPALGRQIPRELVAMLNRGEDHGVRFLPLIGMVEGRRVFLEPSAMLPVGALTELYDQAPGVVVDGELGPGVMKIRATDGRSGEERLAQEVAFDPADPWASLPRVAFELAGQFGQHGAPGRPPSLSGAALARWIEARDLLLVLEANMLQPDVGAVLDAGRAAATAAPRSEPGLRVLVDLARQLVAAGVRDARIAEALCGALRQEPVGEAVAVPIDVVRDAAQIAEVAAGSAAALPLWRRVADDPTETVALVRMTAGLFQADRLDDARSLLRRAVDAGNRAPEIRAQLAAMAELDGDPRGRDRLLAEILDDGADGLPPRVLRLLASWLIDQGRIDDAVEILDLLERAAPELAGLWLERGRAFIARADGPAARAALQRCLRLSPAPEGRDEARRLLRLCAADDYLPLALEVEARLAAGDLRSALRTAKRIARRHPGLAESWVLLGLARQRAGQLRRAVRAFGRALALEPENAEAHHRLGLALAQRGRPDVGFTHLQHAVAIEPDDAAAWLHLAQVGHQLGRPDVAEHALHRAERLGGLTDAIAAVRARLGDDLSAT